METTALKNREYELRFLASRLPGILGQATDLIRLQLAQTYLRIDLENKTNERVRKTTFPDGHSVYHHTVKLPEPKDYECDREIDEPAYLYHLERPGAYPTYYKERSQFSHPVYGYQCDLDVRPIGDKTLIKLEITFATAKERDNFVLPADAFPDIQLVDTRQTTGFYSDPAITELGLPLEWHTLFQ